mmetsp:Transcript_15932/g.13499  ORF Transcript_15932/g.13499 Transcript_15932/m.13499 type:complete len:106 (+) Transcript_15932:458-775(+)
MFRQLISGLEYLHLNGVSHLDIKPENILIGEDYKVKITDFDMAYHENDKESRGFGTHDYRAPELVNDKVEDHQAADIYSMGILLFVLMTGSLPYVEGKTVGGYDL